ncbi:MAG: hypothetical protein ACP5TL_02960 [Candidatus Micrarchaeia archaeon]
MEYKLIFAFAILAVLLTSGISGFFSGIVHFFENLFHLNTPLLTQSVPAYSRVTIYINNPGGFILGLGNYTVINRTNTTISLKNGFYHFDVGSVKVTNNSAHVVLYSYNMTIENATAIIDVRSNNTVKSMNLYNGTFNMSLSKELLNQ